MHLSRPVVVVGTVFALIGLALPFARFPVVGAVDGFGADAWPALLPLVPAVAGALLGDRTQGTRPLAGTLSLISACGGGVFAALKLSDALIAVRGVSGASLGAGPMVLLAAVMVVIGGAALALRSPA